MKLHLFLLLSLFAIVSACSSTQPQPAPGQLTFAGQQISPPGGWAFLADGVDGRRTRGVQFTRHGTGLDLVWIAISLKPGDRLVEASADSQDGPVWDGKPTPDTLGSFLEETLSALGYYGFSDPLTAVQVDGSWSPQTPFSVRTGRGLVYNGEFRTRIEGDRLDLALWLAEAEIYAPRVEADASGILTQLN